MNMSLYGSLCYTISNNIFPDALRYQKNENKKQRKKVIAINTNHVPTTLKNQQEVPPQELKLLFTITLVSRKRRKQLCGNILNYINHLLI